MMLSNQQHVVCAQTAASELARMLLQQLASLTSCMSLHSFPYNMLAAVSVNMNAMGVVRAIRLSRRRGLEHMLASAT